MSDEHDRRSANANGGGSASERKKAEEEREKEAKAREVKSRRTLPVYGVLVLASALMIGLSYYLEDKSLLWSHICRDIGISGLVGFILAVTFERLSKEEFRRLAEEERAAIKTDVFFYVLGYDVPKAIRNEINTQILKSLLIRENFKLYFELKVIPEPVTGEPYMLTACTMEYDVRNLTKVNQEFPLNPTVDRSPVPSLDPEVKFISLDVTGSEEELSYDEQALRSIQSVDDIEVSLNLGKAVAVRPDRLTNLKIKYQTVRFLRRGHLDFVFKHHTCDLELTVRVMNPGIKIFASAAAIPLKPFYSLNHPETGLYSWRIDRPLIAYQSINVTWLLDQPAAQTPADASAAAATGET